MADLSYLQPATMWRETRPPRMEDASAGTVLSPAVMQRQLTIDRLRERARRHLIDASALLSLGAGAFALAAVTVETDAPAWTSGLTLGSYFVATTVGAIKYLHSADTVICMRQHQALQPNPADSQNASPPPDMPPTAS